MQQGNGLASRCCIFILLACACECIWFLEQPGQSILLAYRRFDLLWKTVVAFQKRFWMGAFSGPTPKPHFVISNHWEFAKGIVSWNLMMYPVLFFFFMCSVFLSHMLQQHFKEGRGGYLSKQRRTELHGGPLAVKDGKRYTGIKEALTKSQCLVKQCFEAFVEGVHSRLWGLDYGSPAMPWW